MSELHGGALRAISHCLDTPCTQCCRSSGAAYGGAEAADATHRRGVSRTRHITRPLMSCCATCLLPSARRATMLSAFAADCGLPLARCSWGSLHRGSRAGPVAPSCFGRRALRARAREPGTSSHSSVTPGRVFGLASPRAQEPGRAPLARPHSCTPRPEHMQTPAVVQMDVDDAESR